MLTALGYIVAISIGLAIVLGLYVYNVVPKEKDYTTVVGAFYVPFSRLAWGICLWFVVYSCYTGNAYLPNIVMSYPGWQPLSRLSFSMYLVAPLVQRWWNSMLFMPVYYSYLSKLFESCGVFFVSLVMGLLLSIAVERPVWNLVDHFLLPDRRLGTQLKKKKELRRKEMDRLSTIYKNV